MSSVTSAVTDDDSSSAVASIDEGLASLTTSVPITILTNNAHETLDEPLPPMTTEWNVPQSCTWTYNAASEPVPGATGAVAWLDIEPDSDATTLSCYPDGMFAGGRTGVFSPAICPSGWTTAEVVVNTDEDHDHATTTAICCSSEYSLVDTICKRSVPTVLAVPISYNKTASTHDVLSDSTTTLYSATIAVYTIMAMFRETDKPMLGIGDEDDIDDEPHSRNLSINARIGIGVGSAIAGLLLIAGGIFLFLHCRRLGKKENAGFGHEMGSVHRNCHGIGRDDDTSFTTADEIEDRRGSYGREPPPAYEATTETNSLADNESGTSASREEIRVLRAQKDAIQRRIEELESVETDDVVDTPQQMQTHEQEPRQQQEEPQSLRREESRT
ncbi:hypothetical protein LIA77_04460 [Sarocladium implicatum]|nr:hypothetical protein LIA77_04460 [Sarocladium implicatum]